MLTSATVLAHHRGGGDDWYWFGGLLFWLFVIGLIGLAVSALVRRRNGGTSPGGPGAMAILDERFARGDIDRSEYEHRKAVLRGKGDVPPPPSAPTVTEDPPADSDEPPADRG